MKARKPIAPEPPPARRRRRLTNFTMPPQMVKFLDDLLWEHRLKNPRARRIPRMTLLRALVKAMKKRGIRPQAFRNEKDLSRRLIAEVSRRKVG